MQTELLRRPSEINLDNDVEVDEAVGAAVQDALREHKRRGESVVVWQDGKVVRLSPDEIVLDEAA